MEVLIEKFNHTGEGIGKIDEKIVFIPKTIPGDIVKIKDLEDFKTYYKGKIDNIVIPSNDRVTPQCPYYELCGGCQLMNTSYLNQLKYKKDKVRNILKKYSNIDKELDIILSNKIYEYRNKITLQVNNGKLGLYKYNSNDLIEIDNCLLVNNSINNLIKVIKEKLDLSKINNIMIREYQEDLMIKFIGDINDNSVINSIKDLVKVIYINDKHIYGEKTLLVKLGEYKYKVSPNSFFQVNYDQTERLYDKVIDYLEKENNKVLDLYCGTGSIGIYISKYCQEVTGIEISDSSVKDAIENIKLNNLNNINILKGSVAKILKSNKKYDAIIVDPPRSGLDKTTKKTILEIKSPKLIYISCNPITLARDLNELKKEYNIEEIILVDMFPNTYHIESIVKLSLKKQ